MARFEMLQTLRRVPVSSGLEGQITAVLGDDWRALAFQGEAWAMIQGGEAVGLGGLEPLWPGRAVLWSYHEGVRRSDWGRVFRLVRARVGRALEGQYGRIEATCLPSSAAQNRTLEHLGFEREGLLRRYGITGQDMVMYAAVSP